VLYFLVEFLYLFLKGFHLVLHVLDCIFFVFISLCGSLEIFKLISAFSNLIFVKGCLCLHGLDIVVVLLEFGLERVDELVFVLEFVEYLLELELVLFVLMLVFLFLGLFLKATSFSILGIHRAIDFIDNVSSLIGSNDSSSVVVVSHG
jgi:hypothetical protein